ncbi:ABC transporter permease [Legionella longbeachae]|uniref:Putative ABC transporter, permease protein n=1 Tax=Legionella longbeachae serogroup 1 (strain NSW150) TaxID=661367 RepID=D3HIT3_LEGLN|nr:ABC transporter permease [Legionella longbeachae]VEE02822.1 ABC transporter permease [Legionella oakridgensis]HBD7397998.1 ABC transporter permease [Legionella pneumophila]ARB90934.1 ABC transporter permease [Legionella longbeachae]ARM32635.1 ABC transporter permease [Legionella longbeachae]QIN32568.1 ABC transporter permease subunit [Legionella longbeachae]
MTVEFLWTDKCFLSLLVLSIWVILLSLRKQHVRRSFSIILHRPIAVSAGIILLFFIAIAVLDSIHLMPKNHQAETPSTVLDNILAPIDQITEKTYSAPLALRQFVSETILINGVVKQIYPPLIYSAKIKTEKEKKKLIVNTLIQASQCSIFLILLSGLGLIAIRFSLGLNLFTITSTSLSTLITLGLLTFFVVFGYELSRTFHVLGTGQIGQDIFYFTIKSIRTGLVIGFLTTLFMLPLALFLGVVAGYFGGLADDVIQYLYTTLSSIPGVLLITASVLSLQIYIANHPGQFVTLAQRADARLLALCFILGVTSWTSLCRLLRAETLKLREIDFVLAARALGSNWFTIVRKHLLPNVMHIVVITLVLDFSFLVMAEALLSYVGAGVSPMTISWGNMINSARLELARNPVIWWPMFAAFLFMFLLVLAINLFADAVRDAFDPHQSHV